LHRDEVIEREVTARKKELNMKKLELPRIQE